MLHATQASLPGNSGAYIPPTPKGGIDARELATLSKITQIVSSATGLQDVLQRVVEIFARLLNSDETTITIFNDDYTELTIQAHCNKEQNSGALAGTQVYVSPDDLSIPIILDGRAIVIPNAKTDPLTQTRHEVYRQRGVHCVLRLPLKARGKVIGMTSAFTKSATRIFSAHEIKLAEMAVTQIAGVIANARMFSESQAIREELKEANKKLEAQVNELDAFAQTVAHDIKSPLAVIHGFGIMLQQSHLTAEQRQKYIAAILRSTDKSREIVDSLLLLARINKTEDILFEPIYMEHIITSVLKRLEGDIREKGAQITIADDWPVVSGYGAWVEEVWVNYLSNALKYGGSPPVISLGAARLSNSYIRFWVQDNGSGISRQDQNTLFEAFRQLDDTAKGHGLGLSIVKRIVRRLNGRVGVLSTIGKGSSFYFDLPAPE